MDYDDNDFHGQNHQLAGEGCSKVSAVLHPNTHPKFDFDDSLHAHLSLNRLAENDVFLGITNQEDNQWIEHYSRGNSDIDFNSITAKSRRNNVWYEATSSETVEMLLKSVAQEEKVVKETHIRTLDNCNELTEVMDPNLNQDISGVANSVVINEKPNQDTSDVVAQMEAEHMVNESMVDNLSSLENVGASTEGLKIQENSQSASVNASGLSNNVSSGAAELSVQNEKSSMSFESGSVETKKSLSIVQNVESMDNLSAETSRAFSENPDQLAPDSNISVVKNTSSEENETAIRKDARVVSVTEKEDASLPVESGEMEIEGVQAHETLNNGVSSLVVEKQNKVISCNLECEMPVPIEQASPTEINAEETQGPTKGVTSDSSLPSNIIDDAENKGQSVFLSKATQEEKNFTFEVNKDAALGQPGKILQSYPTFQEFNHKESRGKSERKPRRKSTVKEKAKKSNHPKEITPSMDSVRGEMTAATLKLPAISQANHFEVIKSHENVAKPGVVFSPIKLPDLNNSTSVFQQPFTENQQLQLRAQILVYGSLISGSPPEESHMIAAFGQSDGGRTWEGVWHACLERLRVQKSHPKSDVSVQPQSDNRGDQRIVHPSPQNKVTSSPIGYTANKGARPIITPVIPLSSPLHLYQNSPMQNISALNPSWLSQGPFSGQWVGPAFNPTPHFPPLHVTEPVKVTPIKELGGSGSKHTSNVTVQNSALASSPEPSSNSKSRKRKKATPSLLPNSYLPQNVEKVVMSEETLTKVEESKTQAEEANKHAANAASQCHEVWSQLERRCNYAPDDEAKLVSSAVSIAAAASVAKVAAAAAKIASDIAEQARSMVNVSLSNRSQNSMIALVSGLDRATPDAIIKAAEMAAEAVVQAGKIVAMSEPMSLRDLVEAGPEGYWKTPRLASKQQSVPESEIEPVSDVAQTELKVSSDTLNECNIKEGCLVEVFKDDDKHNGAWFGAKVMDLKDGKALVSYTEIQSDNGQLTEWVPLEVQGTEVPKIRIGHPVTTMLFEGTRKRRRTASTDFAWSTGDRVDVWIQDRWREAVVMETNKIDVTSLTVQFPAQGETSVVRSWFVRPTLVWKDGKWIEYHTSDKRLSSQGDSPQEKRLKLGSPAVVNEKNPGSSESVDHVDPKKQEELNKLYLSNHETVFHVGSATENMKTTTSRTVKSSLRKEGTGVVFGVPKPGKKQKFMDVSRHYVADVSNKRNPPHDSVKFTKYLIPQAPNSRSNPIEKQAANTKSRLVKSRRPPISTGRPLTLPKSTTRENNSTNKMSTDSVNGENQPGHQNQEIGFSSKSEDAPGQSDLVSSLSIPEESHKRVSAKPDRLNKRKFAPTGGNAAKVEKSLPEAVETRRSNRKMQPTSRLLEGLQTSMTISKTPAASHSTPRGQNKVTPKGQNKVTPKGNTNNA